MKKRAEEEGGRLHHIDDGFREEQSKITEWQNLYAQMTIMVLGMGLEATPEIKRGFRHNHKLRMETVE